jgi:hypothetical protein
MRIDEIEGVSGEYGQKLSAAGVGTVESLLDKGAKRRNRHQLAEATGISETLILKWVNRADLMRVKGVGSEYSDLLEAAGVDSPRELSHRAPTHLRHKMDEINTAKKLVRRLPTEAEITAWIAEAKAMPRVVEH